MSAEICQSEKQTYTKPNTVRKGTNNNNREDPPRTEENISNKINITQIDQGRKSLAQDTIYIYMNTKVRCKSRNMTNFNQKVKILKTLNFHYDTET